MPDITRRRLLSLLGAGVAGAAVGGGATAVATGSVAGLTGGATPAVVPFHGAHQAGIVTPAQDRLHFATFDVTTKDPAELEGLLTKWTVAAAAMCAGKDVGEFGAVGGPAARPPEDTGEAIGLSPARLTLTVGFGPGLFEKGRFGLEPRRPEALAELPVFPGDSLDPARCGGDLAIQACSDDPQVAVHAVRNLARIARGTAVVRYSQLGFGRTSSTSTTQEAPRNLMGFKDGTANVHAQDTAAVNEQVWVAASDGPAWMTGGTYLVARRIRMLIEPWDSTPLAEQERVIGRAKNSGAPLGAVHEFDELPLTAVSADGSPVIDTDAHVRLAHSSANAGARLLRRGYSFVDGTDALGRLDAGLFFLAYQRDPRQQFVRINRTLSGKHGDALNEYLSHVGSGVFACPAGVSEGQPWGAALFA